ncbi:MAG TPA: endonuclease/exonuclease/phosphatase family protein [Methylomirabilota bacterium]|nr:endonuclease/exonuclease/phosphatase family protein [Methylomirabilota bacterium]
MNFRIATYNVNNLFRRTALLQLEGFSAAAKKVLDDITKLNLLLERPVYDAAAKADIKALLEKYEFQRSTKKTWFTINIVKGKLYSVKKNPTRIEVVANGRAEWVGWVELVREDVSGVSVENTARVIQAFQPHVLCVVEVEDRIALDRFQSQVLKKFNATFKNNLLVDGNDERGIDVGLYSQFPIRSVRSHINEPNATGKGHLFSRDCPEFEVILPNGKSLWVLVNHFKSQGYGLKASNDNRRKAQADKVREYLARFDLKNDLVAVAGDFNDKAQNPPVNPLQKLLATPNLRDVFDSPGFGAAPRWTYGSGKQQLDYLLVSKPLFDGVLQVGIERRGMFSKTNFGGAFPHFPTVTDEATHASDHAAVWAEFGPF